MADDWEPPPLFNNLEIDQRDDDNEDLFSSAIDVVNCLFNFSHLHDFVSFSFRNKLTKSMHLFCGMLEK